MKTFTQQLIKFAIVIIATAILSGCGGNEDTPTTFFNGIKDAATNNNPSAVWDTIPFSMQRDVDSLAHDLGNQMPAEFYDSVWELVSRVSALLENKREFILNTPMVQMGFLQSSPQEKDQFVATYDYIVPAINMLASSQISSAGGLKTFNTSRFLTNNGHQLTDAIVSLIQVAATQNQEASAGLQVWQSLSSLKVTTVSENGDRAVVQTSVVLPALFAQSGVDGTENVSMTKVDGKWIPSDLHNGFGLVIAEARLNIAKTDFNVNGEQMMGMSMAVAMGDVVLGPLEAANTQAEFDQAIQQLAMLF